MTKPRRRRAQPYTEAQSVVGEGRDRDVLETVVWAGFLTTGQITALYFPTRRRAQRRLRALLDHGLVTAHLQGEALHKESYFTATRRGLAWLDERGAFDGEAPRLLRMPRPQKLAHALGVRETFVRVLLAERAGRYLVEDFHFDSDLTREPRFAPVRLIPDGLARLSRDGVLVEVGVEYDRGTETTTTLRTKFSAWRAVLDADPQLHLLLVVRGARRREAVERLLAEAGCGPQATAVLEGDEGPLLDTGWPFGPAAQVRHSERPTQAREAVEFQPLRSSAPGAFGAYARPRL